MLTVRIVVWFQSPVTRSNCLSDISSLERGRCNRPDGALTHWAWGIFRHVRVPPNPHSEASPRLGTFDREKARTDSAAGANSVSCGGGKSLPHRKGDWISGVNAGTRRARSACQDRGQGLQLPPRFKKLWRTGPCSPGSGRVHGTHPLTEDTTREHLQAYPASTAAELPKPFRAVVGGHLVMLVLSTPSRPDGGSRRRFATTAAASRSATDWYSCGAMFYGRC
jgi:hypothetical protein